MIEQTRSEGSYPDGVAADSADLLPASPSQRRLWFSERLGSTGTEFLLPSATRLSGELDVHALASALDRVIERHEVLRTTFVERDGEPFQRIAPPFSLGLTVEDIAGEDALPSVLQHVIAQPFDLEWGPLIRARLFRVDDRDHVILIVVHHIAGDGWSMNLLFDEIQALYGAARTGGEARLPDLPIQFADFSQWQLERMRDGAYDNHLAFWRDRLAGAPPILDLPADRPRPSAQSFRGDWVAFELPRDTAQHSAELAARQGATQFMVLAAAAALLLSRWSGQRDVVLATAVANRPTPETETLIGFFVNVLPLRIEVDESMTFERLVGHVRERVLEAFTYKELSFDRLVEEVAPGRSLTRSPLVQVAFAQEWELSLSLEGLGGSPVETRPPVSRYDLAFDYWLADGTVKFELFYSTDLFDRVTVQNIAERYVDLLESLLAAPSRELVASEHVKSDERARLLDELGDGGRRENYAVVLPTALRRCALERRDQPAVVDGAGSMSYAEFDNRVSILSQRLAQEGVGAGSAVGVVLPRTRDLLVAFFGIWGAGAAFVAIDSSYPTGRVEPMLRDAGVRLIVTSPASRNRLKLDAVTWLMIEDGDAANDAAVLVHEAAHEDLAYVMFTSGSTGEPKGVAVTHGAVADLLGALTERGAIEHPGELVAWNASASFDASVQQWAQVAYGNTVLIIDEQLRVEPEKLSAALAAQRVRAMDVTPSHLEVLLEPLSTEGRSTPLRLLVGGEAISDTLWEKLRAAEAAGAVEAFNVYGPTECTVDVTCAPLSSSSTPVLGRPLTGTRVYVVDEHLRLVPEDTPGELCVAGPGVARGYVGRSGATASRFVPDIYGEPGARMYRTGDLVRWRNGQLKFLGRVDNQVKVRGFRIELEDVERSLATVDGVARAAVVVARDASGTDVLVGCYAGPAPLAPGYLREQLALKLPEFMIPSRWSRVEAFPTSTTGKLDRPALAETALRDAEVAPETSGPTPIESLIIEVWAEVLGTSTIAPTDNFFALGGHSMLAIRVAARLKKRLGLLIPMTVVFENPSVRELAAHVEREMQERLAAAEAGE